MLQDVQFFVLFLVTVISAFIAYVTNWLALIPWRRARDKHWTERARVYYPVRSAAVSNIMTIPAVMVLTSVYLDKPDFPSWIWIALFSALGVLAGTLPMDREVFPRIALRDLWRHALIGSFMRFLIYFVFLGAAALMPNEFNVQASMIFLAVVALWVLWNASLWLRLGVKTGYLKPAPDRLQKIVNDTAAKMKITVRKTWLLDYPLAQAFALPQTRQLLFSNRLLELVPDDELASICSHELAHLTESKGQYLKRYISLLAFLPWLFFKPMLHRFGVAGFFVLLAITLFVPIVVRKMSHKLETRADEIAHLTEDPGVYARALARLHEDGLIPAVVAKERLTHPHLYDRLLAAGATPDYARPKAADAMAWNGTLFAVGVGILATLLIFGKFW